MKQHRSTLASKLGKDLNGLQTFCISTPTLQAELFHDLGVIYSRTPSKHSSWTSTGTGRSMHHNWLYFSSQLTLSQMEILSNSARLFSTLRLAYLQTAKPSKHSIILQSLQDLVHIFVWTEKQNKNNPFSSLTEGRLISTQTTPCLWKCFSNWVRQ